MHKRTGLRKPKNFLKTWNSPDWTLRLTPRLSVGMVDEELPFGKEGGRKSWYLTVTQDRDLLKELGPVKGAPKKGKTLLLFEDDVVALVRHLSDVGLVDMNDAGALVNGPAENHETTRKRPRRRAQLH
jgi:hypothetical protein